MEGKITINLEDYEELLAKIKRLEKENEQKTIIKIEPPEIYGYLAMVLFAMLLIFIGIKLP